MQTRGPLNNHQLSHHHWHSTIGIQHVHSTMSFAISIQHWHSSLTISIDMRHRHSTLAFNTGIRHWPSRLAFNRGLQILAFNVCRQNMQSPSPFNRNSRHWNWKLTRAQRMLELHPFHNLQLSPHHWHSSIGIQHVHLTGAPRLPELHPPLNTVNMSTRSESPQSLSLSVV